MSYTPPKVYISATTADLRSVRAAITEALNSIGCVPVEVASFESDSATVGVMLREQIESCQALIHIAGARYGPEPDPATLPAGAPRRSYAQMEYHIACEVAEQRGDGAFQVYVFVCPEDFPYDPAPGIEIAEKWALQEAHRNQLPKSAFFCGSPENSEDMRSWALGLQEQFPPPPPPTPALPSIATPAQGGESLPPKAPALSETPLSSATPTAPSPPRRSRLMLVLGILAAVGVVAILAAAWMLQQKGFFRGKVVLQKAPQTEAAPAVKSSLPAPPEPKPSTAAPKTVQAPPTPQPQPQPTPTPATPPALATPPTPTAVVAKKSTLPPEATPVASSTPTPTPSPTPSLTPSLTPTPTPSHSQTREIDLVRSAAVAMNPATRISAAEIGKLYVEQPVLNGKTFTRADVVRQVEQFRRTWDTQSYEVIGGPTVTSGEGTNHVTVKVKTRFSGVRKTGIKFSSVTVTSEFVVIVGADGRPLIESQRELSQE